MIYIVANSKGGVGKSLASVTLACLLQIQNKDFKIVELDNNNQSLQFSNSNFLTDKNTLSVKLDKKEEVASEILFNLMSDNTLDYIVDAGGGNDTFEVLEVLKNIPLPKKYLIPTTRIKKYLQNAADTADFINEPGNAYFVLNQYSKKDEIKEEFIYFFGDKKIGIESVSKNFNTDNILSIPFSNYYQIAEDLNMTLLDLANISRELNQEEAIEQFIKQSDGNMEVFHNLRMQYVSSQNASKNLEEIEQNFAKLF